MRKLLCLDWSSELPSLKVWLSLFEKSGDAFHEIVRMKTRVLIHRLEIKRRCEVVILTVVQAFLDLAQRNRSSHRKPRGHRIDCSVEFFKRNYSIYQSESECFACADDVTGGHQLECHRVADSARQKISRAAVRHQPDLYKHLSKLRLFR